jgi:hypothetical protein
VSETPKTDAIVRDYDSEGFLRTAGKLQELCEELERENADLLRALKDLREQVDAHVVICGVSHFNTRLATEVIDRIEK